MYNSLKSFIKIIIPKKILFKNELFFRSFYAAFYKGKKCRCNICNNTLRSFVPLKNGDLLCPACGSLSRTRRLYHELVKTQNLNGKVLHFSPSRSIFRTLKKNPEINYYSTDFTDAFLADYKFDITNIEQPNSVFNLIICFHILEHITDDIKAMKELYRVLKHEGICYIQTPFKDGDSYEDYSVTLPEEREKHFGQHDHVRIYSLDDLEHRLQSVGFSTKILEFEENHYFGFEPMRVITCKKE